MVSPTDLFHPPPAPHFKTFHVFRKAIYCHLWQQITFIHCFDETEKCIEKHVYYETLIKMDYDWKRCNYELYYRCYWWHI